MKLSDYEAVQELIGQRRAHVYQLNKINKIYNEGNKGEVVAVSNIDFRVEISSDDPDMQKILLILADRYKDRIENDNKLLSDYGVEVEE
ncbi:MAG: hypothetical protein ACOYBC_05430 [Bilifractor sp.]|jgi:hypothetical protein